MKVRALNNKIIIILLKITLAVIIGVFCQCFIMENVYASGEQLYFDEWGNLHMTTYDRIATSNITYKTIGWMIKRYNMPVGYGNDNVVVVMERDGEAVTDPDNPAYEYNYFICQKEDICNRIGDVSYEWQQQLYRDGGDVYLDAFMTVCYDGVPQGGLLDGGNSTWGRVYNNFDSISTAEAWADPEALRSHFDKQVYFPGNPALLPPTACNYRISHCEYFDGNQEVWSLSRYHKDSQGQLAAGEEKNIVPSDFSGYGYLYVSAKITKYYENGTTEVVWTADNPLRIIYWGDGMTDISIELYYKRLQNTEYRSDIFNVSDGKVLMDTSMGLYEGNYELSTFNASRSVPAGEYLYTTGEINAMGYNVRYKRTYGFKTVPVVIGTIYQCQWTDAAGNVQSETLQQIEAYYVDRPYSYWQIEDIQVYTLDSIVLKNDVLEDGQTSIENLYAADITIEQKSQHLEEIGQQIYWIDGGVLYGEGSRPEFPYGLRQQEANAMAGYYTVWNDTFMIDDEVFLAGNELTSSTGNPKMGSSGRRIEFYKDGLLIPETRSNKADYESLAVMNYTAYTSGEMQQQEYYGVNSVTVHTPVVCRGFISDEKQYNQLCEPDDLKKSWILGREFEVGISAYGQHLTCMGYGIQDYSRYVKEYQVKFPFEVYYQDVHYDKDSWITCLKESKFYLPTGVREGTYTVTVRTIAKNYNEENQCAMGQYNNESREQYAACEEIEVVVCGRLYGLKITDIDRDCWKNVFYDKDGKKTGRGYYIGLHNLNGELTRRNPLTTFPVMQGGNPYLPQEEGEPLGTEFSFEMETIGDYSTEDGVWIEPKFYVVDNQSGQNRKEVDVYHFYEKDGKEIWENVRYHKESGKQYLKKASGVAIGSTVRNVTDVQMAQNSVQRWSSSFVLPQNIFVVPAGFDIEAYIARQGSIDYGDDIFINQGYLMVQFEIYTIKNGENHLDYINAVNSGNGYASMWKIEGFMSSRTQGDLSKFYFQMGDVFIYDLEKKGDSCKVVGTH